MSAIYDYAYAHVMHKQDAEIYSYAAPSEELNSESEVNAADFTPSDLQLFVDSLETIARLEQAKRGRTQKRKVKKQLTQPKKRQVTCLDASTCSSIHDDYINSFSDDSLFSEYIYDDSRFGHPVQGQSTAIYSYLNTNTNTISDSEDSGVFDSHNASASHMYENIEPIGSRSQTDSYSKCKSLKSRLLDLIMNKKYAKHQLPSGEILSSTTIGEHSKDSAMHQHLANKPKQKSLGFKSEHKFLNKAMRLLTL